MEFHVGDRIEWTDPNDTSKNDTGVVTKLKSDDRLMVDWDSGCHIHLCEAISCRVIDPRLDPKYAILPVPKGWEEVEIRRPELGEYYIADCNIEPMRKGTPWKCTGMAQRPKRIIKHTPEPYPYEVGDEVQYRDEVGVISFIAGALGDPQFIVLKLGNGETIPSVPLAECKLIESKPEEVPEVSKDESPPEPTIEPIKQIDPEPRPFAVGDRVRLRKNCTNAGTEVTITRFANGRIYFKYDDGDDGRPNHVVMATSLELITPNEQKVKEDRNITLTWVGGETTECTTKYCGGVNSPVSWCPSHGWSVTRFLAGAKT